MHSLFGISKYTNSSTLTPRLASKNFDSMIAPTLTYNSEVWGAYTKADFSRWDTCPIEKVHSAFVRLSSEQTKGLATLPAEPRLGDTL